ncbi:hypothetical protein FA13DRAFT_1718268 [Coprinellus micaceus]|uniref:Uncharacterized protein n=1 Tax=Coprinellus micaceus TaxID=71717 RepID=A0A4Y7SDS0_COPMI|nr:hypothetical protein FA13DRAFT_1718268 [Coprinellus micaceus]
MGLKLCAVAVPLKPGLPFIQCFTDIAQLLQNSWDQTGLNWDHYHIEASVLVPGDQIIFKALRLHHVVTLLSLICTGGHFYRGSTMTETMASLITSLLLPCYITNTSHFIRKLAIFPQQTILGPVLDYRFYPIWNQEAISDPDCMIIAQARGAVMETINSLTSIGITVRRGPPGTGWVTAQQYFDDALLATTILFQQAFVTVTEKAKGSHAGLSNFRTAHQPHAVKLLRRSLCYRPDLLNAFDQAFTGPDSAEEPVDLYTIPLLAEEGVVDLRCMVRASGSNCPKNKHDPIKLIHKGATWSLNQAFMRTYADILKREEEVKDNDKMEPYTFVNFTPGNTDHVPLAPSLYTTVGKETRTVTHISKQQEAIVVNQYPTIDELCSSSIIHLYEWLYKINWQLNSAQASHRLDSLQEGIHTHAAVLDDKKEQSHLET